MSYKLQFLVSNLYYNFRRIYYIHIHNEKFTILNQYNTFAELSQICILGLDVTRKSEESPPLAESQLQSFPYLLSHAQDLF